MTDEQPRRPAALITGAGSLIGIAAGIAARLADDGWDLALSYWKPPDASPPTPPPPTPALAPRPSSSAPATTSPGRRPPD